MRHFVATTLLIWCLSVEASCEKDLTRCNLIVTDQTTILELQNHKIELLTRQRDELVSQVEAPRVPTYIWVLGGVLAGSIATIYLKR